MTAALEIDHLESRRRHDRPRRERLRHRLPAGCRTRREPGNHDPNTHQGIPVSTIILLVGIVATILISKATSGSSSPKDVGFLPQAALSAPAFRSAAEAVGQKVKTPTVASRAEGEAELRSGTLDALVTGNSNGIQVEVKKDVNDAAGLLLDAGPVSRQEDVGAAVAPLTTLIILPYVLGISILPSNPGSGLIETLSMIPLFSPTLMPMRLAAGVPAWEMVLAVVLTLLLISGLVWLAGRIYG
jgi:hypothetical protein